MLIDNLKRDAVISKYIKAACFENEIEVKIADDIEVDNLIIIKVDDYYNGEFNANPGLKSPDCLIIQKCPDHYDIYIVELRNICNQSGFSCAEIEEKFITCLDDFMYQKFNHYFLSNDIEINNIKLYFISDPYGFKQNPQKQATLRGHKFDFLNSIRIPKFFNKHLYIEPHIPNPTIKNCS